MAEFQPETKIINKDSETLNKPFEIGQDFGFFGSIVVDDNDKQVTVCSSTQPLPDRTIRNCEDCSKYSECKAGKKHMQLAQSLGYTIQA